MLECEKELWRDVLEVYREMSFLWDPKDGNYQNKKMRIEAFEMMMQIYQKIDPKATLSVFKKRLDNMRTAFNRERKKAKQTNANGGPPYVPTLWYYDLLTFLGEANTSISASDVNETQESYSFNFNKSKNKIYLQKRVGNGLKRGRESLSSSREERKQGYINISPMEFSEEDNSPIHQPSQSKRSRIHNLLQKQEKFIDTASKILTRKEKDWEVIGKAIGLQLSALEGNQQTIAQKLIADAIFYGNIGRLNLDSFIHVETFDQESPSDIEVTTIHDL